MSVLFTDEKGRLTIAGSNWLALHSLRADTANKPSVGVKLVRADEKGLLWHYTRVVMVGANAQLDVVEGRCREANLI